MTALTLPDLMLSLSSELSRLAEATEGFHDLVAGDDGPACKVDAQYIRRAQDIDHTTQVLADLAEFCANLAADAPADCRLDAGPALSLLRLAELRARLAAGAAREPCLAPSDGALELF